MEFPIPFSTTATLIQTDLPYGIFTISVVRKIILTVKIDNFGRPIMTPE